MNESKDSPVLDPGKRPPPPPEPAEDAGSRALSEALRSSFVVVKIIMVLLVLVFFASGIFTVPSQEKAILLRFGRPVGVGAEQLLSPGLHWSFPSPIDEVVKIPVGAQQLVTSTTGWYATLPDGSPANGGGALNPGSDGYTLTSDANIIHVKTTLRYRISDPVAYALQFVNASNVVQNAVNNAIFHVSAQFKVDDALTKDRLGFQTKILAHVRQLVEEQGVGITVDQADVQAEPPAYVKDAFTLAFNAEQGRGKTVTEAQGYANRILSTASGEAEARINAGKSDRARLVNEIEAEANYFRDQLPSFKQNPQLFADLLQTETLRRIFTNARQTLLPRTSDGRQYELRISLKRQPEVQSTSPNP